MDVSWQSAMSELDAERFGALRDLQVIIERLVRDDYGVRIKSLDFTLADALSPRHIALPFTPVSGEIVRRVEALWREIALACGVSDASFFQDGYGLWVILPRRNPENVLLRDYLLTGTRPAIVGAGALGVDIHNHPTAWDIPAQPHTLIVGTSNAGKSNTLLSLLVSMAYWWPPRKVQFYVLDGKGGASFAPLDKHPLQHIRGGGVLRSNAAMLQALREIVSLMKRRYQSFAPADERTLVIVLIDELAEALRAGGDLLESNLSTILQKGRAAGIHVVATTPKADTQHLGTLASFFNGRVVMKTVRPSDSYLASNSSSRAHRLALKGDMLAGPEQRRVQGFHVLPEDVPDLLGRWLRQASVQRLALTGLQVGATQPIVADLDELLDAGLAANNGHIGFQEPGNRNVSDDSVQGPDNQNVSGNDAADNQYVLGNSAANNQHVSDNSATNNRLRSNRRTNGRPTKPITDTEVKALKAYIAAEGSLPTLSQLVKGKFARHPAVQPILNDDERYTPGLLGHGCMAQSRAERLLDLAKTL